MPTATYDDIADWYEDVFLSRTAGAAEADGGGVNPADGGDGQGASDRLGIDRTLRELLGPGHGPCLEIGCGTGIRAAVVRELGWTPVGVDVSAGMLRRAVGRLPIARADAEGLPVPDSSVAVVITVMAHTDMPGYPAVLREVARVLRPGGRFVHVGVHPCFCGGFADRSDPDTVLIRPGYLDSHWTKASWTDQGARVKVGATHWPLPALLHAFLDAGLALDRFAEGGTPTPTVLAIRAVKPLWARQPAMKSRWARQARRPEYWLT